VTKPTTVCFSYLAAVHTLRVPHMPQLNYGVDVIGTEEFLAGDGPIVAGALAALGHSVGLVANAVGDDTLGWELASRLRAWSVLAAEPAPGSLTRTNVVACDDQGNRTWFSGLRGVADELARVDLDMIANAEVVYIDCYEVLADAPLRAVRAALDARAEVYLNLGGGPPPSWLTSTDIGSRATVVQTNAAEHDAGAAGRLLDDLAALDVADLAVVTLGRHGAIARTPADASITSAAAIPVAVRQVQGAGSVFSGALIDALTAGANLQHSLNAACTAASLWCARTVADSFPTNAEIAGHDDLRMPEPAPPTVEGPPGHTAAA
jgi:sugar/nucleoside kinase (ribokinase family)